jgi:hypothetical protein
MVEATGPVALVLLESQRQNTAGVVARACLSCPHRGLVHLGTAMILILAHCLAQESLLQVELVWFDMH